MSHFAGPRARSFTGSVRQYQFDLPATLRFPELIDEYGRMRRLEEITPQRRGQRFNQFVAGLLDAGGADRPVGPSWIGNPDARPAPADECVQHSDEGASTDRIAALMGT